MSTRTWTLGRSVVFMGLALAAALMVDQIVGCLSAAAQQRRVAGTQRLAVPSSPDELILQMSQSAGVIFAGEVIAVRPPAGYAGSPANAAEGVVEIDFRVDRAVRGVAAGSIYTLHEWAGLWAGGTERYRTGQRLLMLLHAADGLGLASPVHGPEGVIPLRGAGKGPGPDDSSSVPAEWMVDLRWLQAQTLRPQFTLVPPRDPVPVRRGRRPVSESASPMLVRALPGPWLDLSDSIAAVEPLSYVLELICAPGEPADAPQ